MFAFEDEEPRSVFLRDPETEERVRLAHAYGACEEARSAAPAEAPTEHRPQRVPDGIRRCVDGGRMLVDERELGERQAVSSSATESASSRIAIPSSSSSTVMFSGGHTMTTFQWVMR